MLEIEEKELIINEELKRKIEIICKLSNTVPTILNGTIRKINKTN